MRQHFVNISFSPLEHLPIRLYSQAEAMCKQYKTPILLIEFDPDRAFTLQVLDETTASWLLPNASNRFQGFLPPCL